jgi:hypothetical protein
MVQTQSSTEILLLPLGLLYRRRSVALLCLLRSHIITIFASDGVLSHRLLRAREMEKSHRMSQVVINLAASRPEITFNCVSFHEIRLPTPNSNFLTVEDIAIPTSDL